MSENLNPSSQKGRAQTRRHHYAVSALLDYFWDPLPLAFSAAGPFCRVVAESFGGARLAGHSPTHAIGFSAANYCGVGLRGRYSIVRVPRSLSRSHTAHQSRARAPATSDDGLLLLLDPLGGGVANGPVHTAVVVRPSSSPLQVTANHAGGVPAVEMLPLTSHHRVAPDAADQAYIPRGVFTAKDLGDLDGGERYGHRKGCVQNYLSSLDSLERCSSIPFNGANILLVFLRVERQDGRRAHLQAVQHLEHVRWWLERCSLRATGAAAPVRHPTATFVHVYGGGDLSLFRYILSSVPSVYGITCVRSPWFRSANAANGAASENDDGFAAHDDDEDEYIDIGTALSGCESPDELRCLQSLCYLGVFETPLTSKGLDKLIPSLPSLRHLTVTQNNARAFNTIGNLGALPSLTHLTVDKCSGLTSTQGIESSSSLQELSISYCTSLFSITPLASLRAVRSLRIDACSAVSPSPFMEAVARGQHAPSVARRGSGAAKDSLQQLRYLQLSELDNPCRNMSALSLLPHLAALDLHLTQADNSAVAVIAENCANLEALSLAECLIISDIEPLGALAFLSHLLLRNTSIDDASLRRLCANPPQSLQVLDMSDCEGVSDFSCLSAIHTLVRVNARGSRISQESACKLVRATTERNASDKNRKSALRTIDLRECPQLKYISKLLPEMGS